CGAAGGAALSFNVGLDQATASVGGGVPLNNTVTIETDLGESTSSTALATAKGTPAGGPGATTVLNNLVTYAKNHGWLPASFQLPSPRTADGIVTAAAAFAVNVDLSQGTATVAAGGTGPTPTPPVVRTLGDVDASALADGTPANGSLLGLGVAVAINVPRPAIQASIAGAVAAPAVNVLTLTGSDGISTFRSTAFSGAGVTATGVARALATNVPGSSSEAGVADGASLTIGGGALTVNSTSVTENVAQALAQTARPTLGVGASVALNAALNGTTSDVGAASVTGAGSIDVEADATHQVATTTAARAGIDPVASAAAVSA